MDLRGTAEQDDYSLSVTMGNHLQFTHKHMFRYEYNKINQSSFKHVFFAFHFQAEYELTHIIAKLVLLTSLHIVTFINPR